jgi:hypothetical protein
MRINNLAKPYRRDPSRKQDESIDITLDPLAEVLEKEYGVSGVRDSADTASALSRITDAATKISIKISGDSDNADAVGV